MVAFCAERGVSKDDWPIYYGVWEGDAKLDDITARCVRLRQAIVRLDERECAEVAWLSTVREWLERGEVFAVFE
ncbi:MAG TPA: hypothetical protein VGZ25_13745 [Gemmataceae bacterium]|nr:hypothetical protein [Gemmataceae bacterium]